MFNKLINGKDAKVKYLSYVPKPYDFNCNINDSRASRIQLILTSVNIPNSNSLGFKTYDDFPEKNQTASFGGTIAQLKNFHKITPTTIRIKITKYDPKARLRTEVTDLKIYEKYFDALKAQFLLNNINVKFNNL